MGLKHYMGKQAGRIAGVPGWSGGPYITANVHLQEKIERHPFFKQGLIKLVEDEDQRSTGVDLNSKAPTWEEYIKSLNWTELRALAKDRDVSVFGRKAIDLIEELTALGE